VTNRFNVLRDAGRTLLWPIPVLAIGLAVAAGIGLPRVDARFDRKVSGGVTAYLFGGGPDAARSVLSAVAGSLITVTSLTFSLTVVTLQLASSQFSPRLLRTFTRDRLVHVTLALFLSTFTFALMVLRTVRSQGSSGGEFVPRLSVTLTLVLAVVSVIGLVLFLAHLARQIRVETMVKAVHAEASETVARVTSERTNQVRAVAPSPPEDAFMITASRSGFLSSVAEAQLLEAVVGAEAFLVFDRLPGDSLVAGTPMAWSWPSRDNAANRNLAKRVAASVATGYERVGAEDISYGLRQLTDVVTKALSPGINDPTTAIHALSHSSALLCELASRDLGPRLLCDEREVVRVVLRRPSFASLLDLAVSQPCQYGVGDPAVAERLLALLREVAWSVASDADRRVVRAQLVRTRDALESSDHDDETRVGLHGKADLVDQALRGRWDPASVE
jgi:uncharacterized membrane protein